MAAWSPEESNERNGRARQAETAKDKGYGWGDALQQLLRELRILCEDLACGNFKLNDSLPQPRPATMTPVERAFAQQERRQQRLMREHQLPKVVHVDFNKNDNDESDDLPLAA